MKFETPMKICICSEFPPPYGGIGVQAMLLSDSLELNSSFEVCRISNTLPDNYFGILFGRIKGLRAAVRLLIFIWKCSTHFSENKIIHILSGSYLNFFLYTTPAVLIGKLFRKPVIVHYHGGAADAFLKKWGWLAKPILKIADTIIVPSGFLKQIFFKYDFATTVVPNIIPLENFRFKKRASFEPKILMTRHLEPIYNISCAIRGFALLSSRLPEAVLTIAGSGSEKETLEELASSLGCRQQIIFLGAVDSHKIHELYGEHDILLNTSNVDNLPLSILEGFACGLLVVTTKAGGIPYVVEDNVTGLLVDMDDSQGVADSIGRIIRDKKLAQQIVVNAHTNIPDYSWVKIERKIKSVYVKI